MTNLFILFFPLLRQKKVLKGGFTPKDVADLCEKSKRGALWCRYLAAASLLAAYIHIPADHRQFFPFCVHGEFHIQFSTQPGFLNVLR